MKASETAKSHVDKGSEGDLVLAFILIAIALAPPLVLLWRALPESESLRLSAFVAICGLIIAAIGAAFAIISFRSNATRADRQIRRQHTVTILLEARLSSEFQQFLKDRRLKFPEYQDITFKKWDAARKSRNPDDIKSADAVVWLLNYYEFLAAGIRKDDLDEMLLKETVRSILCNLVDDARYLIAGMQAFNPRLYQNLAWIYDRWRIEGTKDINGNPNERAIPTAS